MDPSQVRQNQRQGFVSGNWRGEFHPQFGPIMGDIVATAHWAQIGFAKTDLDAQLKQLGAGTSSWSVFWQIPALKARLALEWSWGYHVTLVTDVTATPDAEGMHARHKIQHDLVRAGNCEYTGTAGLLPTKHHHLAVAG
jgi:nicotinamidase-related amidase